MRCEALGRLGVGTQEDGAFGCLDGIRGRRNHLDSGNRVVASLATRLRVAHAPQVHCHLVEPSIDLGRRPLFRRRGVFPHSSERAYPRWEAAPGAGRETCEAHESRHWSPRPRPATGTSSLAARRTSGPARRTRWRASRCRTRPTESPGGSSDTRPVQATRHVSCGRFPILRRRCKQTLSPPIPNHGEPVPTSRPPCSSSNPNSENFSVRAFSVPSITVSRGTPCAPSASISCRESFPCTAITGASQRVRQ